MTANPIRWKLHWQILLSLTLSVVFALLILPTVGEGFEHNVTIFCGYMGKIFMNALKMVIVPLVVSSIIAGVMQLGAEKGVGRMGGKTLLYYTASGAIAVTIGLIVVNLLQPGNIDPEAAQAMLGQAGETASQQGLMDKVEGRGTNDMIDIVLRIFPDNIVNAATSNGNLLGIITFSLLFGLFIGRIDNDELRETQQRFWEGAQAVMLKLTEFIIRFAPIGVFGLVTPVIAETPIDDLLGSILLFFVTVLLALTLHAFLSLGLMLRIFGGINPLKHYRAMAPVMLTAFSTASSSATLPLTMETVEEQSGVSKKNQLVHPASRGHGQHGRHGPL